MKKPKRKTRKPRNSNKNSMLASTEREEYQFGSIAKLGKLGSDLKNVITDVLKKSNEQLGKEIPENIQNVFKESERLRAEGLKGNELNETTLRNLYGEDWENTSPFVGKHVEQIRANEANHRGGGKTISDDASLYKRAKNETKQIYRAMTTEGTVGQKVREEGFGTGLPVDRETRKAKGSYFLKGAGAGLGVGVPVGGISVLALDQHLKDSGIDPEQATPEQIETAKVEVNDKVAQDRAEQDRLFSKAFGAGASEFVHNGKIYAVQFKEQDIAPKKDSQGRIFRYIPELERALPVDPETNEAVHIVDDPMPRITKQAGSMVVPPEMEAMQAEPELIEEEVPVDTYPNATPEELEGAQEPDAEMEEGYMEFILDESLNPEEQEYLMNTLEADPQLSMIFDKVVETASEFSGAGEVEGPGDGLSDSIPARLSDGEFVMTKKATDQIGSDNLQTIMDEAEQAYDGGLMRQQRYLGGEIKDNALGQVGIGTDDDIRKLMSIKANKTPSLR